MKNLNLIKRKLPKKDTKVSFQDSLMLLAEFFNGVVIELEQKYTYDT